MDWIDRINDIKFSIETGDGKTYFPLYKNGESEKEYNTSSFEFISVYGTLVDRKKPQGRKLPLVFWFTGADNIEQAANFEVSADDPRQWKVTHPFYGIIYGQPISIRRDDSSLNVTEVTVPFWESINADYPFSNFNVKDNTRDCHSAVFVAAGSSYVKYANFASADIAKNSESCIDMAGDMQNLQDNNTYSDFQNALNKSLKAIDKLLEAPLNAIQTVQNFVDLPATYIQAIEGRLASYENIYNRLKKSITTLTDKRYYESVGASVISCMNMVVVNPIFGDYVLVSDVFRRTSRIADIYQDYLDTLGDLQVGVYDVRNTYTPDATVQSALNTMVNYTISNLYAMSFETKRERIVYVDKNTNVILLAHRYLGPNDEDENINTMIKTNDIKLDELFSIKKGRMISYAK